MSRPRSWLGQPQETPASYIILLVYGVLMFPGRRPGADETLADWAFSQFAAQGLAIATGEPWRLVSYAFVHGGFVHLICNAVSLLSLAPPLERWLGAGKFLLLYAVTALVGGLMGILWHGPWAPLVGGSGALFGMMGAVLALNMRAGRHVLDFLDHAGTRSFLGLIFANLILGWVIPGVSNAAHLGGLLAGFVLTLCFLERGRALTDKTSRWAQAGWAAVLVTTTLYALFPTARADYLLLRSDDPEYEQALSLLGQDALPPRRR